jgi:hypothetical protein
MALSKIYVGQTSLQIRLSLNQDISNVYNRVLIRYRKPNGIIGYWPAEVLDPICGMVAYTVPPGFPAITDTGLWMIWAYVFFKDGSIAVGDASQIEVFEEGENYIAYPYGLVSSIGEGEVES